MQTDNNDQFIGYVRVDDELEEMTVETGESIIDGTSMWPDIITDEMVSAIVKAPVLKWKAGADSRLRGARGTSQELWPDMRSYRG